ncbi:MAG TPA: MerR family transcriptional regulator [Candidatus Scatomorpha merdigallinarum]|nr:MerR family transcriptional regulator [Candidatus Scatomorpha merdigallinarum]
MKQCCEATGMSYEALKFYCNEGLVPNVKRAGNNYRVFDMHDVNWIRSLACLKRCGMSIQEMKEYLALCLQGQSTIPQRMELLEKYKQNIHARMAELQDSLDFIAWKENFYREVLEGKTEYHSDLIAVNAGD